MTNQNKQVEISSAIYNILTSGGVDQDFKEKLAKELGIELPLPAIDERDNDEKAMEDQYYREREEDDQESINNSDIK